MRFSATILAMLAVLATSCTVNIYIQDGAGLIRIGPGLVSASQPSDDQQTPGEILQELIHGRQVAQPTR